MKPSRSLRHTLGLLLLLILVAVPATTSGATTVRTFSASAYLAERATPLAAPPVTIGASAVIHFGAAPPYGRAGIQGTAGVLQGTTVVLPSCTGACTDRYSSATGAALGAGNYAERVIFTVTQPRNTGPAVGFDLEIAVHLTTGWVVGTGYLSTGVSTGAATATVTLRIYVNLGTAAPTVEGVEVVVNECHSTTGCP